MGAAREAELARLRGPKEAAERALQAVFQGALARYLPEYYTGELSVWSGDARPPTATGTPPFARAQLGDTLAALGVGLDGDAVTEGHWSAAQRADSAAFATRSVAERQRFNNRLRWQLDAE